MILGDGLDQKVTRCGFSVPLNPKTELNLKTTAALKMINYVYHFPAHGPAYVLSTTVRKNALLLTSALEAPYDLVSVTSCTIYEYVCMCAYTHTYINA